MPESFAAALAAGRRGGAVLFRRNCVAVEQVAQLCADLAGHAPAGQPPLVAVDQEGGRVVRLPEPFTTLPPMRLFGAIDDEDLTERAARQVGRELAALGFTMDLAPVLDVDSNPDNPVIGDRSFGSSPASVGRHGVAFARGLQAAGVAACGKHFPGHGDTALDSHVALPTVDRGWTQLESVELPPFRAACASPMAALMSAHVVYPTLDAERPATLSAAICTELLRNRFGFTGALLSDDLEMGAIAGRGGVEQAAVAAVAAGCDAVLICSDEELQERAHRALVGAAERDLRFADRCEEAARRVLELRRRYPPRGLVARPGGGGGDGGARDASSALAAIVGGEEGSQLLADVRQARRSGSECDEE